jgi:hypothetical protein
LSSHTQVYAGRPVRRLVSFFDGVRDLVEENDRRMILEVDILEGGIDNGMDDVVHTLECEFSSFILGQHTTDVFISLGKTGSSEDTRSSFFMYRRSKGLLMEVVRM